jgi:hypothetical protein
MLSKSEVAGYDFYISEVDGMETKEVEIFNEILGEFETYEESINELVEADVLDRSHDKFICKCLGLEGGFTEFYDDNKLYCIYLFAKKLLMANLDGTRESEIEYIDSLAKLVKSYDYI